MTKIVDCGSDRCGAVGCPSCDPQSASRAERDGTTTDDEFGYGVDVARFGSISASDLRAALLGMRQYVPGSCVWAVNIAAHRLPAASPTGRATTGLRDAAQAIVDAHAKGAKQGRADYVALVSADKIERLRLALAGRAPDEGTVGTDARYWATYWHEAWENAEANFQRAQSELNALRAPTSDVTSGGDSEALRYSVVVAWSEEDRAHVATSPEWGNGVSGIHPDAPTAVRILREVIRTAIAALADEHLAPPAPLSRADVDASTLRPAPPSEAGSEREAWADPANPARMTTLAGWLEREADRTTDYRPGLREQLRRDAAWLRALASYLRGSAPSEGTTASEDDGETRPLAEMWRDAERLDWLERAGVVAVDDVAVEGEDGYLIQWWRNTASRSLRLAIDDAMRRASRSEDRTDG